MRMNTPATVKYIMNDPDADQNTSIWAAAWQNQENDLCAQRRPRSAWASAQTNQSLRCRFEEILGS